MLLEDGEYFLLSFDLRVKARVLEVFKVFYDSLFSLDDSLRKIEVG